MSRRTRRPRLAVALGLALSLAATGCGGVDDADLPPRVAQGRQVYRANCTACHAADPGRPGALGPAVAGASRALLEAKVLRGTYPEGYLPKRGTRAMMPLPFLEARIPELAAYLEWAAGGPGLSPPSPASTATPGT